MRPRPRKRPWEDDGKKHSPKMTVRCFVCKVEILIGGAAKRAVPWASGTVERISDDPCLEVPYLCPSCRLAPEILGRARKQFEEHYQQCFRRATYD